VTAPRRGRGRPALFDTAARARYLDALTAGATKKDAAAAAGVAPKTARGKAARLDRLPHGASRYVHHDCRCPICTKAASAARAGCLDRAPKEATIVPITPPDQGSPKTFPLADAS
jgi:hypothetical protein